MRCLCIKIFKKPCKVGSVIVEFSIGVFFSFLSNCSKWKIKFYQITSFTNREIVKYFQPPFYEIIIVVFKLDSGHSIFFYIISIYLKMLFLFPENPKLIGIKKFEMMLLKNAINTEVLCIFMLIKLQIKAMFMWSVLI